ncbi:MAG: DUF421 domain-containing protein [Armatimonadetes bacterium]|nr:DUF421 domain-containing protein [Armatimonadota bacterium]
MDSWLKLVFSHPDSWPAAGMIVLKTSVVYAFLVGGLRFFGKRQLGQMTLYDIVLMVVLANSVQNAMVGEDTTLAGGLISATTLLILNRLLFLLIKRNKKVEHELVGEPVILLRDGKLQRQAMEREGITREQVQAALREHGLLELKAAELIVLEVDGSMSVIPHGAVVHRSRRHYRALRTN